MPTSNAAKSKILIVAAEASSSLYAQRLLEHWRAQGRDVEAFGIGSRAMEQVGFECLGRSEELAVVGIQEVLGNFGLIWRTFHSLVEAARQRRPDVVLLLDYPDFNLRLAKKIKALGIPVVYYISPQIWAWRESRVNIIRDRVDKMLVLFPFEEPFYQRHGVAAKFVGHPLLDELDPKYFTPEYRDQRRSRYGVDPGEKLLALMPGSRNSELKHHLEPQLAAARILVKENPQLKVALLVAPTFRKEEIQARLPRLDFPIMLIQDEPFAMIHLADVVLCASGTATLMVGLMEKPMVIMYRMNALTAWVARKFVKSTKYFGMINLVLDQLVCPELFQEQTEPEELAKHLRPYLENASLRIQVAKQLHQAKDRLGQKGATLRVAAELEEYFRHESPS